MISQHDIEEIGHLLDARATSEAERAYPSTVAEEDIARIEAMLPAPLPPYYRAFLCSRFIRDLDFGDYTLPSLTDAIDNTT